MIDRRPNNSKTRGIKILISFILFILGILNIYFLLTIAKTIQLPLSKSEPSQTFFSEEIISPTTSFTSVNTPAPTQSILSVTQPTPSIVLDIDASEFQSPFSIQIAALHQMSIKVGDLGSDLSQNKSNHQESTNLDSNRFKSLASAIKESGADWVRLRIEWELIEPYEPVIGEYPKYDWKYHDDNLRLVADTGVKIIATLSDSPGWAADVPCGPIRSDRLDEYARYLRDLIIRYNQPPFSIKHWELVNEPDSNRYTYGHISGNGCWAYDGNQYAQMLMVAYQAIKQTDPEATVLMGGLAYDWFEEYGGPFNRYFPDDVMENGGGNYIDVLNFHFFTDFHAEWDRWNPKSLDRINGVIPAPTCGLVDDGIGTDYSIEGFDVIAKTTHFKNRMDVCYGILKPIWITEVSAHGDPDDPDSMINQSRYVIMVYVRALSTGVKNITWFSLDQPPYDPNEQALLSPDFSPKPAFFTYQTLTREMRGFFEYIKDRNVCFWDNSGVSCPVEAYIFRNNSREEKTVAWGTEVLSFQADQLRVVDRSGGEAFIKDGGDGDMDGLENGTISLQLTADPVFVSIN